MGDAANPTWGTFEAGTPGGIRSLASRFSRYGLLLCFSRSFVMFYSSFLSVLSQGRNDAPKGSCRTECLSLVQGSWILVPSQGCYLKCKAHLWLLDQYPSWWCYVYHKLLCPSLQVHPREQTPSFYYICRVWSWRWRAWQLGKVETCFYNNDHCLLGNVPETGSVSWMGGVWQEFLVVLPY